MKQEVFLSEDAVSPPARMAGIATDVRSGEQVEYVGIVLKGAGRFAIELADGTMVPVRPKNPLMWVAHWNRKR